MRIIHTSDLHIGSPLSARLPAGKREGRQNELISNPRRLAEEARAHGASAIIIAGDLFDESEVNKRAKEAFLEAVRWASDISFFYLTGNHDAETSGLADKPKNLYTFGKEWTYYELGGVVICGREELSENAFDTLTLSKGKRNVAVLHGELRERSASPRTVGIRDAENRFIDYLALGHYHSYSVTKIDERGVAVYSGTPEGRGFDETGECGYVLIDVDEKGVRHRFIPFARRRIHDIRLPIDKARTQRDIARMAGEILSLIPHTDIVRLELVGGYSPELWKDSEALKRELSGERYYLEIKDSSRPRIDFEDLKNDKSLRGEFIRLVLADGSLSDTKKEGVILAGISALSGEESFPI